MRDVIYLVASALSLFLLPAMAADTDPLSLDQVMVLVLENNPQLKADDLEARAAAAGIREARLSAPYRLTLDLENVAGSGDYQGADRLETTLSLAKVLETGAKPTRRGELAEQRAKLLRTEQDARRLDLLAEAARRFVHLVVDQQRLEIAQENLARVGHMHEAVERRVRAGASPVSDRRLITISLARAEIELEHAEHELASSRLRLSTLWGETQPMFGSARADLFALQSSAPFETLALLLENNPELIRLTRAQRLAEARLQLARSRRRADIELGAGLRYLSGPEDAALVFSASVPLGTRARAAPGIESAQRLAQSEPFNFEQRHLALYGALFEVYQEMLHARTALNMLQTRMIPEAEMALGDYQRGYNAGRYSILELSAAQQSLLELRREAVMAGGDFHRYRIEIERLTGTRLPTGVKP